MRGSETIFRLIVFRFFRDGHAASEHCPGRSIVDGGQGKDYKVVYVMEGERVYVYSNNEVIIVGELCSQDLFVLDVEGCPFLTPAAYYHPSISRISIVM